MGPCLRRDRYFTNLNNSQRFAATILRLSGPCPGGPAGGRPEDKLRQGPMSSAALRRQGWVKIGPMRVFAFNQIDFPVTLPLLDLPFPNQRCLKTFMGFEPHETVHAVFGGKAGDGACFVLPNSA